MPTRRQMLRLAAGLSLLPVVNLPLRAAEKVALDDPAASALKYVQDATQAARSEKMGVPGAEQFCSNCRFYTDEDGEWGGCALFQNKLVAANGWCSGWVPTA